ncbi:hypothetical protein [Pseudonocardia humida]|uniref:hypothetical protein n=1 Tax=Pseudonocardia humida TaxID=2800819 RepID=UPI00207C6E16|nr:hypothetical protein [Pseudonocardia humida]
MAEAAVVGAGSADDRASRLERARGLLRGFEAAPARPVRVTGGDGAVLPVVGPLAGLLPAGGLRRGTAVAVADGPGSSSLLLALLAEASASGAWVGLVGRPQLGVVAAAEAGIRVERLALVPHPGADLVAVTSALLDGLDVVAVAGAAAAGVRAADRQRLAARARQRDAVLLSLGPWPGADAELTCADARWLGLGGDGGGRLLARRLEVRARGRGIAPRGRSARMLLPAPGGALGVPDAVVPGEAVAAGLDEAVGSGEPAVEAGAAPGGSRRPVPFPAREAG